MKTSEIFSFVHYRDVLRARLYHGGRARRGELSALADAIPCQVSYLSRVMSGTADLSSEQADSVTRFLNLSSDESYYFLLLVQWARAGTHSLKAKWEKQISLAQEERLNLQKRTAVKDSVRKEDQATYYSHWYYAAVHVITGIPALQTKEAMCRELGIQAPRLAEILEFLKTIGLVIEKPDGRFVTGLGKIFLKKDSPMSFRHHANWRMQAMRCMDNHPDDGIHYSVLVNTSRKDAERLRAMIAEFVEQFMQIVHPSVDEEMNCLNLDFFNPRA